MAATTNIVKAPTGSYPKLWRLLDHYFLKEDVPDRSALLALDTIVALNEAILSAPKSANNRVTRSSDPQFRNLADTGGTDVLQEIGWRYKVMRMEECWVFPYDGDLDLLKTQQEKIIETQQKLKTRLTAITLATKKEKEKTDKEKEAIMRQIEADKLEREHRNAIRSGAPPKPTQSLDEIRRQAVKERMERDKARKAKSAAEAKGANEASPTSLPGSFPSQSSLGHDSDENDAYDEQMSPRRVSNGLDRPTNSSNGAATGGRTPRQTRTPRKARRAAPTPIAVKKPVVKEKYVATENKLGGSETTRDDMDEDEMIDDDHMKEDEDEELSDLEQPS